MLVTRVLIVDDDEVVRALITAVAETMGYDGIAVQNGVDALKALRRELADLVITDIFMPDMDGLELIRGIRAGNPALPILAMSSPLPGRMDLLRAAKEFGASDTVHKPIDVPTLRDKIAKLLTA
jgi:CheY-like chemotaxis protein